MSKLMNYFCASLTAFFLCGGQAHAESYFVRVNLAQGVSVDLPKSWIAKSNNQKITLGAFSESALAARNLSDIENVMPFAADYYDDRGKVAATFGIRFYPKLVLSQAEAIAGGAAFINELDAGLRQKFGLGMEAAGGKMIDWLGTIKYPVNGTVFFVSENRSMTSRGDIFRGYLVRYLNAGKSFTVMISYREDQEPYLKPISNRIINSIRHN